MAVTLVIVGGITLFIAFAIREIIGGKRSSAGVHRSNGKLLSTESGVLVTVAILAVAAFSASSLVPVLIGTFGTAGAIVVALFAAYIVIKEENYSRT